MYVYFRKESDSTVRKKLISFSLFPVLAEQTDWNMIMVWLVICGFVRGAALINFTITISEYSSLEKLPAAFGLHMVGKGLFVVAIGPVLGKITFQDDKYILMIFFLNFRCDSRYYEELSGLFAFADFPNNAVLFGLECGIRYMVF